MDWNNFKTSHLLAPVGKSIFSLNFDTNRWDWSQLWNPYSFKWTVGVTPMSDLGIIVWTWAIYFTTILSLKFIMRNREPMKLLYITAIHNLFLCFGSLGMFIAGGIAIYETIRLHNDPSDIFCSIHADTSVGMMPWALYIYYLSKFPELLDTVILVLKKKNVIFLHWYHHAIVMLMVWTWIESKITVSIFGLMLNTGIHVLMYWYYTASSFGWNVWYKKYITKAQIIQFVLSFIVLLPFAYYGTVKNCEGWDYLYFSMIVNFSFLVLFCNFYLNAYKKKAPAKGGDLKKNSAKAK
ncbi:GNS1/SUR4 family-domain-containing protein [Globomyces pollinis-pini]|nr:GNS1/SUR4 family-domain-containing protein [Globomyces pollinis-pini]